MTGIGGARSRTPASPGRAGLGRGSPASRIGLVGAVLVGVALAGCTDPVFEPIKDSDYFFSVYGYLDASADTQWIRVMPPRTTTAAPAEPSEATVTLEDLETGEEVVLRDSIFQFGPQYLHNFWTTMEIRPGGSYRLTAMRPDGATSRATVAIPEEFPVMVRYSRSLFLSAHVRVEGVEHVPFVDVRHHIMKDCEFWDGPPYYLAVPFEPSPARPGVHEIDVNTSRHGFDLFGCSVAEHDIFVVASGAEWPSGAAFSPDALGVVGEMTNVENGLGFLGGVLTKAVLWQRCRTDPPGEDCTVTHDAHSATLQGMVMDADCGVPVPQAQVELTEILPDGEAGADGRPRVKMASTEMDGSYRIVALDGGATYELDVSYEFFTWGGDTQEPFEPYVDTVTFEPGEHAGRDVALHRKDGC